MVKVTLDTERRDDSSLTPNGSTPVADADEGAVPGRTPSRKCLRRTRSKNPSQKASSL